MKLIQIRLKTVSEVMLCAFKILIKCVTLLKKHLKYDARNEEQILAKTYLVCSVFSDPTTAAIIFPALPPALSL
jgi:hypothetical protein